MYRERERDQYTCGTLLAPEAHSGNVQRRVAQRSGAKAPESLSHPTFWHNPLR